MVPGTGAVARTGSGVQTPAGACGSGAGEAADRRRDPRRATGSCLRAVGPGHHTQTGVDAEPAQRLWLPVGGVVADPGQPGGLGVRTSDQIGQGTSGQVRGRQPVTDITAGPADPSGCVAADRGAPAPGP